MNRHTIQQGAAAWLGIRPSPLSLTFELSHRCNLSCRYCDRHTALQHELSTAQILSVLAQFHRLGMRRISLDGGDPLLHRDLQTIVDWLDEQGVVMVMNSNGIRVPRRPGVISRLAKLKISLDGPRAQHDAMRGKGAFGQALHGIQAATEVGVPVELTCVVGRHNAHHLEALLDIAEEQGCGVVFQPARASLMVDRGRGRASWQLGRDEVRAALRRVARLKREGRPVANGWASLKHYRCFPEDKSLPCAAGWVMATLDPEGVLYACDQDDRRDRRNNVLAHGVEAAFGKLPRRGCAQCWCARLVEANYAWGLRLDYLLPPVTA